MNTILFVSSILLWAVVLFNLLITFQLIKIIAPNIWEKNSSPKIKKGQISPSFTVDTLEGIKVTLDSLKGQSFIIIFISSQCNACTERLPEIQSIHQIASRKNIKVSLICDTDSHKSRIFANEYQLSIPVWSAPKNENQIWIDYKVRSTPYYCIINEKSRLQTTGIFDTLAQEVLTKYIYENL